MNLRPEETVVMSSNVAEGYHGTSDPPERGAGRSYLKGVISLRDFIEGVLNLSPHLQSSRDDMMVSVYF